MQGMIHHHAQALDMTTLVASHSASDDMRKLVGDGILKRVQYEKRPRRFEYRLAAPDSWSARLCIPLTSRRPSPPALG